MFKRTIILALATMLVCTGCRKTDTGETITVAPESSVSDTIQQDSSASDIVDQSESGQHAETDQQMNAALSIIPGCERLLEANDQNLFLLKEYGFKMEWMEANQISNLERGTPLAESEVYFLLLPKYVGSQIEVERLEWDEENMDVVPVETLYKIQSTPDEYGLILTSNEPETMPNLRVTVQYGADQYSRIFSYDGRGDRPALLVFPEDENWGHQKDSESSS